MEYIWTCLIHSPFLHRKKIDIDSRKFRCERGASRASTNTALYNKCKTSMKKLAVLTVSGYGRVNDTRPQDALMPGSPPVPVRGVNVILGGVMLSAIIMVIFVLCYCCHKSNRKSPTTNQPSTFWRDPEGLSMEIYTVDTQTCIECQELESESRRPSTPGPPPPYDLVVPYAKLDDPGSEDLFENSDLPSYERACQLNHDTHIAAHGYV
ncbi:hypothetical protein WA026_022791 [Henosepilachna vigintioctopunctata]|uniref:Uncharacterized protein n=1 Tax=Henosepilachna vigintioctopunctata TaxID=420089 RepID=A0AAW1VIP3_9CUCU